MSEDPKFYRDAVRSQFMESLDTLRRDFPELPPEVLTELEKRWTAILDEQFREGLWGPLSNTSLPHLSNSS
jgi:hypothetical protein